MMQIFGLERYVAVSMKSVLGEHIFHGEWAEKKTDNDTVVVVLNSNAIVKFYGFDHSVCIQLGAKKFILEEADYYELELG